MAIDSRRHSLCALLNSGSQLSFTTEKTTTTLLLHQFYLAVNIRPSQVRIQLL